MEFAEFYEAARDDCMRVARTALNANVSWWRRHRREVELADHDIAVPAGQDPVSGDLVAALRRLPVRQREVITLRLLLDLDTATTAKMLGMPCGTVPSHLHRGLAALRRDTPALDDQELSQ